MTVLGSKIARIQDSNFRVRSNNSNETSLFLDRELANAVGIMDNADMTFILNRNNLLQILSYIFSYPGKINYGKNSWTPSLSELRDRLDTLDVFFKHQDTAPYTVRGVVQTEDRKYFKDLKKSVGISNSFSSFNIRDFLLEGKTRIVFEELNGQKYIRLEIDDISTVLVSDDSSNTAPKGISSNVSLNKIFFGAPGTGKSYQLQKEADQLFLQDNIERVTFYPNYSYAQFVGTYKPVMENCQLDIKNKEIVGILGDKNKTAQEKYDELYGQFRDDNNLTRLPALLGIYCGNDALRLNTRKIDGTPAANSNNVEVNSGIALRNFIPMQLHPNQEINYKYVPGPFMRIYTKAKKNPDEKFLLIIEELNRANAAAVFGDLFQLLDRFEDGSSEYPVATSEDLRQYLTSEGITDNETISLPANMYIWTTMNSADQGVFPMDTAFRRRWDCEYLGIDTNEDKIIDKVFKVGGKRYLWNDFRKAINSKLLGFKVNEDKLLGPFYVKPDCFNNPDDAAKVIKDKVLMYLYEDAGRPFRNNGIFFGCDTKDGITYSAIRDAFDRKGGEIFGVNHIASDENNIGAQNQFDATNNSVDEQSPTDRTLNIYRSILYRLFAGVGLSDSDDRKSQDSQNKIRTYIQNNQQNDNTRGQWFTAYNYFLQHPDFLNDGEGN